MFACFCGIAACGSFTAGKVMHDASVSRTRITPATSTRLAQADEAGFPNVTLPQVADNKHTPSPPSSDKRTEEKRVRQAANTFEQVYSLVEEHFVDALPDDGVMSQGAVRSMVAALEDEQSIFLTPEGRRTLEAEDQGHFAGIGAVTAIRSARTKEGYTEKQLVVVAPLPDSPASAAGLRTGDRITHLDGRYILGDAPYLQPNRLPHPVAKPATDEEEDAAEIRDGIGLQIAQMALRQDTEGKHTLQVARPGVKEPLRFTVVYGATEMPKPVIKTVPAVHGEALYIRLPALTDEASTLLATALQSAPQNQPVLLDLRQNPGIGSLDAARKIAALLAERGNFAVEIEVGEKHTALKPLGPLKPSHHPVAVLTDAGTASFAEVLAASLSDARVGTVVGTGRTFGDGRLQTLYPLPDGSAFTLTTGRFVGPRGTQWDKVGLAPAVRLSAVLNEPELLARAARIAEQSAHTTLAAAKRTGGVR